MMFRQNSSVLTYTPHSPQEFGSIECFGKNDVGLQQRSCKFQIIPSGPPSFPFHCIVVNQSYDSIFVQCSLDTEEGVSNNNSWNSAHLFPVKWQSQPRILMHPKTVYVCEVYHLTSSALIQNVSAVSGLQYANPSNNSKNSDTSQGKSSDSSSISFQVPNLPSETTLRFRIFASNPKGKSDAVWIRATTTKTPEFIPGHNRASGIGVWNDNVNDESESPVVDGSSSTSSQSASSSSSSFFSRCMQYLSSNVLFNDSTPMPVMVVVSFIVISSVISLSILFVFRFKKRTSSSLGSRNSSSSNVNGNVIITSDSQLNQYNQQQYTAASLGFKNNSSGNTTGGSDRGVLGSPSSNYFLSSNAAVNQNATLTRNYDPSHQLLQDHLQQHDKCTCCPPDTSCFETDSLSSSVSQQQPQHNRIVCNTTSRSNKRNSNDYSSIHPTTYQYHHLQNPIPDIFPYASLRRGSNSSSNNNPITNSMNDPHILINNSSGQANNLLITTTPNSSSTTNNSNNTGNCLQFPSNLTDKAFVCESFGEFTLTGISPKTSILNFYNAFFLMTLIFGEMFA